MIWRRDDPRKEQQEGRLKTSIKKKEQKGKKSRAEKSGLREGIEFGGGEMR